MIDIKVFKDNTLVDGLIKRTSPVLDEMESNTMHKDEEGEQ